MKIIAKIRNHVRQPEIQVRNVKKDVGSKLLRHRAVFRLNIDAAVNTVNAVAAIAAIKAAVAVGAVEAVAALVPVVAKVAAAVAVALGAATVAIVAAVSIVFGTRGSQARFWLNDRIRW